MTAIRDSDGAGRALSASSRPAGGTLRWQAPELLGGESDNVPSTPATDVYAFACTCYEVNYTLNIILEILLSSSDAHW